MIVFLGEQTGTLEEVPGLQIVIDASEGKGLVGRAFYKGEEVVRVPQEFKTFVGASAKIGNATAEYANRSHGLNLSPADISWSEIKPRSSIEIKGIRLSVSQTAHGRYEIAGYPKVRFTDLGNGQFEIFDSDESLGS
jgi:hypothetical protein